MIPLWRSLTFVVAALSLTGCVATVPGRDGTTHHVILGFGVVSTNTAPDAAVVATTTRALGLSVTDRPALKVGLGYSSSSVVTVAPGAKDVRVEVSQRAWEPFVVDVHSAVFDPEGRPR